MNYAKMSNEGFGCREPETPRLDQVISLIEKKENIFNYKEDLLEGLNQEWFPSRKPCKNGQLKIECYYKEGKLSCHKIYKDNELIETII